MAPQIIYLALLFVQLLLVSNNHGKEKNGKYNIWTSLLAAALVILLLIWGGFFDVFIK